MSAGPDGRYVRCTIRDWGNALAYWWVVMLPVYCLAVLKFIGQVAGVAGGIAAGSAAGLVGDSLPLPHLWNYHCTCQRCVDAIIRQKGFR